MDTEYQIWLAGKLQTESKIGRASGKGMRRFREGTNRSSLYWRHFLFWRRGSVGFLADGVTMSLKLVRLWKSSG